MTDLSCGREKEERGICEVQFATGHYFYLLYLQRKICVREVGALFSLFLWRRQEADVGNDDTHTLFVKIAAWIYFLWSAKQQCTGMFYNDVDLFRLNFAAFDRC